MTFFLQSLSRLFVLSLALAALPAAALVVPGGTPQARMAGEVIVRFRDDASIV